MDQTQLEEALRALTLGPLRYQAQVDSTNTQAAIWARAGAPDLALVLADEQTAGRGRAGRGWFTPPGAALAFSLVLRPASFQLADGLPATALTGRLTGLGALAISQALQRQYNLPAQIKWPNDVLLAGRKVAGILVEGHWLGEQLEVVILGIGVNVAPQALPPAQTLNFPATCVQSELGRPLSRLALLQAILAELLSWRQALNQATFMQAWENALAFRGEWVDIFTQPDTQSPPDLRGQLLGLDSHGALQVRRPDGEIVHLQNGEIRLRPGGFNMETVYV